MQELSDQFEVKYLMTKSIQILIVTFFFIFTHFIRKLLKRIFSLLWFLILDKSTKNGTKTSHQVPVLSEHDTKGITVGVPGIFLNQHQINEKKNFYTFTVDNEIGSTPQTSFRCFKMRNLRWTQCHWKRKVNKYVTNGFLGFT